MKTTCRYFFIDIDTGSSYTVGKRAPCQISFVYKSHIQVHFRTVLIFRMLPASHLKHDGIFHWCGYVMFLKAVSKYLEHSDK